MQTTREPGMKYSIPIGAEHARDVMFVLVQYLVILSVVIHHRRYRVCVLAASYYWRYYRAQKRNTGQHHVGVYMFSIESTYYPI